MFSFNLIIPERTGNSNSEDHHVIEKEVEKEPNKNPKESKDSFSWSRLIFVWFIGGNNQDATKWEDPKESE